VQRGASAASPPTSRTGRTLVPAPQGDACRPAWRVFAAGAGAAERESQIHAVCAGLGKGCNRHSQTLPGLAIGAGLLRDSWALRLQPCIAASSRAHIAALLQAGTVVISLACCSGRHSVHLRALADMGPRPASARALPVARRRALRRSVSTHLVAAVSGALRAPELGPMRPYARAQGGPAGIP